MTLMTDSASTRIVKSGGGSGAPRHTCVLSASTYDHEGGIQRVTQMVLRFLQNELANPSIELFSLHDRPNGRREKIQFDTVAHHEKLTYRPFSSNRHRFASSFLYAMRRNRPSLVVVDHAHLSVLPQIAFPVHRPPILAFVYHAELPNLSRIRRWSLRRSDLIVAISEFAAREAERALGGDCPITVCRLGLFPEYETWAEHPCKLPAIMSGRRPIVIVGRMVDGTRDKGHEALIRAMPEVVKRVPEGLLVVVGRGGDEARLRALSATLKMENHVHFAGYVSDTELPAYYRGADVFAMPSFAEGFGLVYLEAMYHAKPCIAGNLDAAREIVTDGETGLLVTPGDVRQVENALIQMLTDRSLAIQYGSAGRKRFDDHFTYDRFATRFRQTLKNLPDSLFATRLFSD